MATRAVIDIPRFLHEESLRHDVKQKISAIDKKNSYTSNDIEKAKNNLYDVLGEEVENHLKDKEIIWKFGATTALKTVESNTDMRPHKVTLEISDDVVYLINESVQTALFLIISALESLIIKQSRPY